MEKRVVYVDLLKIVATFSVILLHVAASNWGNVILGSYEWNVINFYDSIVRFGVPIFVMSSGLFMLNTNKTISIKNIFSKYILRILIAFVSWSLLYAVYTNISQHDIFRMDVFFNSFIFGHYHLWYLYMIIGLYIITPILRSIVLYKRETEYFLFLSFILTSLLPIIIKYFNLVDLDLFLKKFDLHFTLGYVGYYIIGYYLNEYELKESKRNIIYVLGVLGIISTYILTNIISIKTGKADSTFYSNFSPNVVFVSIAIFVFFKYEISRMHFNENVIKIITVISACTFRIYLVHDFFNMFIAKLGISTLTYNPLVSIPFIAVIVFICSLTVSYIIGKTPLLKRIL